MNFFGVLNIMFSSFRHVESEQYDKLGAVPPGSTHCVYPGTVTEQIFLLEKEYAGKGGKVAMSSFFVLLKGYTTDGKRSTD
jgi:hypothetical protein